MSNREPEHGSPSDHEADSTSASGREPQHGSHVDREPATAFHMEELEPAEWKSAPLLTRGILCFLCLGAIVMGGAGWLMLLPAIGMMWSKNFLRWRRWAQILVPLGGLIMLVQTLGDAATLEHPASTELLVLIGAQILYTAGLTWAVWEPRSLRAAGIICFTGFATMLNIVLFHGVPG